MSSFLDYIVQKACEMDSSDLHKQCFVFPTRRSGLIFKNHLVNELSGSTLWSPEILSIEDFIIKYSRIKPAEELILISELYRIYSGFESELSLDKFYSWGQVLIRDFDEVDRYLRDGRKLYSNLKEIREIDSLFHDEESLEVIQKFRTVLEQSKTDLFAQFAYTWEIVSAVYAQFSEVLKEQGIGYMGMLYKDVAEQKLSETVEFENVHFVGFNALSRSEELIIEKLVRAGKACTYWDVHQHFFDDLDDHSGKFIRQYHEQWNSPEHHWVFSEIKKPEIKVYNASGHVAQTQAACQVLNLNTPEWNETAMVLGDEHILMPLLYGLPETGQAINITMGYPVKNNPLVHFIKSYLDLQSRIIRKEEGGYILSSLLLEFLGHSHIKIIGNDFQFVAMQQIRENRREFTSLKGIKELLPNEYKFLLEVHSEKDVLQEVKRYLDLLFESFPASTSSVEKEVTYVIRKHLNQFEDLLFRTQCELNYDFLWKLLNESLSSIRVNFSGEPVRGLQIMGFLESRVLGYNHLFLLSMNEGHMPQQRGQMSYIPYSLRRAFGLPTFEEKDAIYGYHFKRLIFHAKHVHLFYNSELAYDGTGEMSRFIRQIIASDQKVDLFTANAPIIKLQEVHPPVVKKEKSVWLSMQKYMEGQTDLFKKQSKISPTALTTYIQCELKFYFRYVLGLKEQESDVLEMEPRDFGNLFHEAMENIYRPWIGKILQKKDFDLLLNEKTIKEVVNIAFKEKFPGNELKGRNLFYARVNERLIKNIIKTDRHRKKIKILELETESLNQILSPGRGLKIKVGGVVDRIDQVEDNRGRIIRIIDYKTGQVTLNSRSRKSDEEYVSEHFKKSEFKTGFQLYFYAYLYQKLHPEEKVIPGIYTTNKPGKGPIELWNKTPIDDQFFRLFEENLNQLLLEIFDQKKEFRPVEDTSECEYCPYTTICLRHQKKPS